MVVQPNLVATDRDYIECAQAVRVQCKGLHRAILLYGCVDLCCTGHACGDFRTFKLAHCTTGTSAEQVHQSGRGGELRFAYGSCGEQPVILFGDGEDCVTER